MNGGSGGSKDNGGNRDGNDNDNDNKDDDDDDNDDKMPLPLIHLLFDCCVPIKQLTCC